MKTMNPRLLCFALLVLSTVGAFAVSTYSFTNPTSENILFYRQYKASGGSWGSDYEAGLNAGLTWSDPNTPTGGCYRISHIKIISSGVIISGDGLLAYPLKLNGVVVDPSTGLPALAKYVLTVTTSPVGVATPSGGGSFTANSTVQGGYTLTDGNYTFSGWSGADFAGFVTMTSDKVITANFAHVGVSGNLSLSGFSSINCQMWIDTNGDGIVDTLVGNQTVTNSGGAINFPIPTKAAYEIRAVSGKLADMSVIPLNQIVTSGNMPSSGNPPPFSKSFGYDAGTGSGGGEVQTGGASGSGSVSSGSISNNGVSTGQTYAYTQPQSSGGGSSSYTFSGNGNSSVTSADIRLSSVQNSKENEQILEAIVEAGNKTTSGSDNIVAAVHAIPSTSGNSSTGGNASLSQADITAAILAALGRWDAGNFTSSAPADLALTGNQTATLATALEKSQGIGQKFSALLHKVSDLSSSLGAVLGQFRSLTIPAIGGGELSVDFGVCRLPLPPCPPAVASIIKLLLLLMAARICWENITGIWS